MQLFGISIPTFAVAIGTIITAFIAGFGMGMGSELGKYIVEKYWKPRLARIHANLDKHIITPIVKRTKTKSESLILEKAFKKKDSYIDDDDVPKSKSKRLAEICARRR